MREHGGREHGGPDEQELRELGIARGDVLDFSVNVNPYGPSPAIVAAIREAAIDRYPDPSARAAREALASTCGVAPGEIVLGSGAADLLWTLARSLLRGGRAALVVGPTFSEFREAAVSAGARVVEWRASAEEGFRPDRDAIAKLARDLRPDALYLCAPNNPTGAGFPASALADLAAAVPETTLVVDQSFLRLSDDHADLAVRFAPNVVCVRSLTKDHAIPGVRVGYAIAAPAIVHRLEQGRPAWATSTAAQAAAVAAARENPFIEECRLKLAADRDRLAARLRALGLNPVASAAPFLMVATGRTNDLRRNLLARHGVLVRDCSSFGLPRFVRLAARPEPDVERLATALAKEIV